MAKVRQDAWSHEDDLLLAETVLRHIREGSTQLNAFEEVGDKLNRTSAACGFRWNAEIRKKYIDAIELAKRQRKEKKRSLEKKKRKAKRKSIASVSQHYVDNAIDSITNNHSTITLDTVIQFLNQLKKDFSLSTQSRMTLDETKRENDMLKQQISKLEKELSQTRKQLQTIKEDYQVFVQIMDRARKMTVLEDTGSLKAPSFRMDKNGNLEQVIEGSN
ncbi:MAG TPA: RsfA family transcriptional regulator [Bacillota bacterium]